MQFQAAMPFSFFKPSKPKTPLELVKATREALLALDAKTVAEVRLLDKELLTKHETVVSEYLIANYIQVFVANPNKPPSISSLLLKNREKLLKYLENLHFSKEDEQFEEEKDLLVREIEGLRLPVDRC